MNLRLNTHTMTTTTHEHKDLDKANNTAGNHRLASYSENRANIPKQANNHSGYKGVIKLPASKRTGEHTYRAEIQHEGNRVAVSGLECPVQAAFALSDYGGDALR